MQSGAEKLPHLPFWSHVDALRSLLIRVAAVVVLFSVLFFALMPDIFAPVILAPTRSSFPTYTLFAHIGMDAPAAISIVNIRLTSQFMVHMWLSVWMAVVAAFPLILFLVWQFIAPALYKSERSASMRVFALSALMFYLGVALGYFLVFPLTLRFLADYQLSPDIANQISLDSYIDNFLMLVLVMGLVFELPLLTWLLGKFGLISRRFFASFRRHAVVALLILAAVITPTGDPLTLLVVFLPLYLLWELSAFLLPVPS